MLDPGRTIDVALAIWFVLAAPSVGYVGWDAFTRNPELKVMRYGWVLVTLYTGPIGGALYVLSCQEEPTSGTHERFIVPLWKQGLGSTIHCLAGDATGIIAAAIVTSVLGLPMGIDSVIEYVFGFGFGLLIFQALFMRTMLGGSYVGREHIHDHLWSPTARYQIRRSRDRRRAGKAGVRKIGTARE